MGIGTESIQIGIIDDDHIYQFTCKHIISSLKLSIELESFQDGEDALDYFKTNKSNSVHLPINLLLDINMPKVDGWAFLEAFKEIHNRLTKKVKIYLVSSSIDESDTLRASEIPLLSGYIFKPMSKEKILKVLNALIS